MKNIKLLTIDEISKTLALKKSRIRTAIRKREIPFVKIGHLIRFSESEILNWIRTLSTQERKRGNDEY